MDDDRIETDELQRKAAAAGMAVMTDWNYAQALHIAREQRRRRADDPYTQHIGEHAAEVVEEITRRVDCEPADPVGGVPARQLDPRRRRRAGRQVLGPAQHPQLRRR